MLKLIMIKNIQLDRLIEIQKINGYKDWQMAEIVNMSIETWRRWKIKKCFTNNRYKVKELDKVINNFGGK